MRGNYYLRDWEVEYWRRKLRFDITHLSNFSVGVVKEYTDCELNTAQLDNLLIALGWAEEGDAYFTPNGQYHGKYHHPDHPHKTLHLKADGMTFDLAIFFTEDE